MENAFFVKKTPRKKNNTTPKRKVNILKTDIDNFPEQEVKIVDDIIVNNKKPDPAKENLSLKRIIKLQEEEHEKELKDIQNKIDQMEDLKERMKRDFKTQCAPLKEEINRKNIILSKLESFSNDDTEVRQMNIQLIDQISQLEEEKNNLEFQIAQVGKNISEYQAINQDLRLRISDLPYKNMIEELLVFSKQSNFEANTKLSSIQRTQVESEKLLETLIPQFDSLNLDAEDLHEQNVQLYKEYEEIKSQYDTLVSENINLNEQILSNKGMVTLEFINIHIESEEKKAKDKIEATKEKIDKIISVESETLKQQHQELDDRKQIMDGLLRKIEQITNDIEEFKNITRKKELQKIKRDHDKEVKEIRETLRKEAESALERKKSH